MAIFTSFRRRSGEQPVRLPQLYLCLTCQFQFLTDAHRYRLLFHLDLSNRRIPPLEPIRKATRTGTELLKNICQALSVTTNYRVVVGSIPDELFDQHRTSLTASSEPARNVLERLFQEMKTPLSWQPFYDPSAQWYGLNIDEVTRAGNSVATHHESRNLPFSKQAGTTVAVVLENKTLRDYSLRFGSGMQEAALPVAEKGRELLKRGGVVYSCAPPGYNENPLAVPIPCIWGRNQGQRL